MQVALDWFRHLEFHKVERGFVQAKLQLGLRNASLAAFGVGMICLIGALGVGLIFSVQTTLDWQAVQLWRIEWLLGATASFLAGILLKKSAN
jgi:cytosine/uracil/thiamine/allantoin permease